MTRKICLIFYILLFASCVQAEESQTAANPPQGEYRKITPEKAKELMVEGNLILDVRTPEEFEQGHIPGAVLLPVQDILNNKLDLLPDKGQIILVYCRSGNRSAHATRSLIREGYTNVIDFGGIIDWPYEIE
ncbi:MAG: rhodanese-like domain-containing protein [Spirochaetes bacterium]|jgi:phage shock protein E|nr:rhodanese-like domain-containing protein [Spirochaetota bacterium]